MIENELRKLGYRWIISVDETGNSSIAGPIVACAYLSNGEIINGVDDSKLLKKNERFNLRPELIKTGTFEIKWCDVLEIEQSNIYATSNEAKVRAVLSLIERLHLRHSDLHKTVILTDGNALLKENYGIMDTNQLTLENGDSKIYGIACASILAKCYLDSCMIKISKEYPQYGWEHNSGAPTKEHIEAIKKYGLTKYHRLQMCEKYIKGTV